jgi:hypothetical protein
MVQQYNLTTKDKVKAHLGITGNDYNDLLDNLCNQITAFIEKVCGNRRFKETTYTNEIYDGDSFRNYLQLKQYPIIELIKIEYKENDVWKEYNPRDYEKYESMIYFYYPQPGKKNIRISYKAGYKDIPYDLEMLATKLVARIFEKRKAEGLKSESLGEARVDFDEFLKEEDKLILKNYQRL